MKYSKKEIIEKTNPPFNWAKDQDDYLIGLVEIYGDGNWWMIKEGMSKKFKDFKQGEENCRDRWRLLFSISEKKATWSERERYFLLIAHQKYRNKWSEIARVMQNTTRNVVKNRFYTLFRKIRNKVKNMDMKITSPLDLLETYYILNLMDEYLKIPPESVSDVKHYALKLAQRIDLKKLLIYKNRVIELYHDKGIYKDLFKECGKLYGKEEVKRIEKPMECNKIELNENGEEEKRPAYEDFYMKRKLANTEKDSFRYNDYFNGDIRSAQATYSALSSVGPSFFNQVQSTGNIVMGEDEGFGFSQFINSFEGNNEQPSRFTTASPNTSSPFIFQSTIGTHEPMGYSAERNFQIMYPNHLVTSAFMPYNRVPDMMYTQPMFPICPELNCKWSYYPNSQ